MLVLTRRLMEKLYIGDSICVTVVRLEGGQVRLGIEAPREIAVVRAELLDRQRDGSKPGPAAATAHTAAESPAAHGPAPVTTPRAEARGTGIRRRGPSR
jgi:carbon storage regulator